MFHLRIASFLAKLLDNQFKVFRFRFGIDPLIGLFPWVGDAIGLLLGIYIIWIGAEMRLPREKINQMLSNVFFDFVFGIIPIVGDMADFAFKANSRNIKILREYTAGIVEGRVV